MVYLIRAADRAAFKRCRRAWDLGSRNRQNYEPLSSADASVSAILERAVHDALAVYYYPGMWEWDRTIVLPLVHRALDRSMRGRRPSTPSSPEDWAAALARGHALLDAYVVWAPSVDTFTPIRVDTDFEVNVPDPAQPGERDLVTADGEAIRYTDRIDLLAVDANDAYWAVQHRLVSSWTELDTLLLDERTIAWCWAWELFYLGMRIAGTVYNEIRVDAAAHATTETSVGVGGVGGVLPMRHRRMYAQASQLPPERVRVESTDAFRRTRIRRRDPELAAAVASLAAEALQATDPDVAAYPSPSARICPRCQYRPPCLALNEGADPAPALAASYRVRPPEQLQEGRLGGVTWSMNRGAAPPRWTRPTP